MVLIRSARIARTEPFTDFLGQLVRRYVASRESQLIIRLNEALRTELLGMAADQQELGARVWDVTKSHPVIRGQFLFLFSRTELPEVYDEVARVTSGHGQRLAAIVGDTGWPTATTVGVDGAGAAWLILQHMDSLNSLRRELLPHLRRAVTSGEAPPEQLAAAIDRMLLVDAQPQRYGTHLTDINGALEPVRGVEQPDELDHRRDELGLASWQEYVTHCRQQADDS